MESGKINLTFSSLNVNSLNVLTLRGKVSKTIVKTEGITGKKADILFLCNCRMGRKRTEVEKMFNLSRNGKYKIYYNSSKDSRGVAIAIKANIFHEINNIFRDDDENVIHIQVKIQGTELNLICKYGPNSNDIEFYRQIRARSEMNGQNTIIGRDFNPLEPERP